MQFSMLDVVRAGCLTVTDYDSHWWRHCVFCRPHVTMQYKYIVSDCLCVYNSEFKHFKNAKWLFSLFFL